MAFGKKRAINWVTTILHKYYNLKQTWCIYILIWNKLLTSKTQNKTWKFGTKGAFLCWLGIWDKLLQILNTEQNNTEKNRSICILTWNKFVHDSYTFTPGPGPYALSKRKNTNPNMLTFPITEALWTQYPFFGQILWNWNKSVAKFYSL